MASLPIRELKEDIKSLRYFAMVNSNNDIGKKLNKILDFLEKKLEE